MGGRQYHTLAEIHEKTSFPKEPALCLSPLIHGAGQRMLHLLINLSTMCTVCHRINPERGWYNFKDLKRSRRCHLIYWPSSGTVKSLLVGINRKNKEIHCSTKVWNNDTVYSIICV